MTERVMVAVDDASPKYDRLYTYAVPEPLAPYARKGARVLVPFGAGRPRAGVIVADGGESGTHKLKSLIDVERGAPSLGEELLELVKLLRETTFCTYAEAVRAVCPKSGFLVASEGGSLAPVKEGHLETVYEYTEGGAPPRLTEKQRAVCDFIKDNPATAAEIAARAGVTRAVADRLAEKGIIKRYERLKSEAASSGPSEPMPTLTAAQRAAADAITAFAKDKSKPDVTLLFGVTGSGKTLVYIDLIKKTAESGRASLVLVPEIALATQMIARLRALFGARVGIIHSALADGERRAQWERIRSGEYDVVVGTRSAVFAPAKGLGLIVIDEEQEGSYISENSPRYDARAVAAFRAKRNGAHLLLASATPSIESFYKAKNGVYNLARLEKRFGDAPLPEVKIVDMRSELLAGNSHYISRCLKEAVDKRLERGEQCILLLNRRGYRTLSMCCSCKKIVKCPSCDTPLVIHKSRGCYVCHYCGHTEPISEVCGACGGKIKHTGIGTQKIEEELGALFEGARVLRLDVDAVSRKGSAKRLLSEFGRGEHDIIIGTQMIAKGLDFPNVTLAGVLSVDALLLMPSFRAAERTFSMLTQVVGRSGRGERIGEAIVQTLEPDRDVITLAAAQDYEAFYEREIASRRAHLYPPFCAISSAGVIAESEPQALRGAAEFARLAEDIQKQKYPDMPIRILGPAPMRVAYINELFRYRVVFKSRGDAKFRALLRECVELWNKSDCGKKAKLFIDFNGEQDN